MPRSGWTCLIALCALAQIGAAPADEGAWTPLFDGRSLRGWTPKIVGQIAGRDPYNTFRVEGDRIVVGYEGYGGEFAGRFGHLFWHEELSDFRLKLEYRFAGSQLPDGPGWANRNSGVMILGQRPETMAKGQDFPVSIEVQFLGGLGQGDRPTANLCTPGTNVVLDGRLHTQHCTNSSSPTFHGDQWVQAEIEVKAGVVRHFINGAEVMRYEQPQMDPNDADARRLGGGSAPIRRGTISLQSESAPIEFRAIMLKKV